MKKYDKFGLENLEGDRSLLAVLSPPLDVEVVKDHCSVPFSLTYVPNLMRQGIASDRVRYYNYTIIS